MVKKNFGLAGLSSGGCEGLAGGTDGSPRGLVCLDLDGTLLNPQKQVSNTCRKAIEWATSQGVVVAVDSGRHSFNVFELMDSLGLPHTCVCLSGAVAFLDGDEVSRTPLETEAALLVTDVAEQFGSYVSVAGADFNLMCGGVDRGSEAGAGAFRRYERFGSYRELREALLCREGSVLKAALHAESQRDYEWMRAQLLGISGVSCVRSDVRWVDVVAAGCSKAVGVCAMAKRLGLPRHLVAVVGDDENDVEAVRLAGFGIAMGNALPQVRSVARFVVADNAHDGAAEAIELAVRSFL